MKNKIKAILFDFDGVIADTMEDLFLAWKFSFHNFGINIRKEDYFPLEGTKVIDVAKIISEKYRLKENPEKILELKNKYYIKNHKFSFYPGVLELVEKLISSGKKIAVATASPKEKIEKTVPKEFLKKFDVVICSEDYERGKPDPDPYLTAMNKLGLIPEECIVIENAPFGIKSAKLSGAYCIALTTTLDREYLKEADIIFESHDELSKFLNSIADN